MEQIGNEIYNIWKTFTRQSIAIKLIIVVGIIVLYLILGRLVPCKCTEGFSDAASCTFDAVDVVFEKDNGEKKKYRLFDFGDEKTFNEFKAKKVNIKWLKKKGNNYSEFNRNNDCYGVKIHSGGMVLDPDRISNAKVNGFFVVRPPEHEMNRIKIDRNKNVDCGKEYDNVKIKFRQSDRDIRKYGIKGAIKLTKNKNSIEVPFKSRRISSVKWFDKTGRQLRRKHLATCPDIYIIYKDKDNVEKKVTIGKYKPKNVKKDSSIKVVLDVKN